MNDVNAPRQFDIERGHFVRVDHLQATDYVLEQYIYEYSLLDYASLNDNTSRVGTLFLSSDTVRFIDHRGHSVHTFDLTPTKVTMKRKFGDQVFETQKQLEVFQRYTQFDFDVARHLLAFLHHFYNRADS